jgi:hypothetical protein
VTGAPKRPPTIAAEVAAAARDLGGEKIVCGARVIPGMKRILAGLLLATCSVSSAFAQEAAAKPSDSCAEQRKHDPKKVCTLSIEGTDLDGARVAPNGDQILAHPPAHFGSLIRYRTSMLDKMAKDVDRF